MYSALVLDCILMGKISVFWNINKKKCPKKLILTLKITNDKVCYADWKTK